jgi:hypothetical protein
MKTSWRRYRYVLLATAAGVAALAGSLVLPAAASAQPASTPATPTITLALSPATVDYGHQSVTASGTVTTSAGPVADAAVTVSYVDIDGQPAQVSLTTGSDGSYSGAIPDPEAAAQEVTATVAATSTTTSASASAQLGFTTDAVTITASFDPPYVNPGSTSTLSGVATYVSGGTTYPLANSTLTITAPDQQGIESVSTTVTTAANGSFSYVTPEVGAGSGAVQFSVSSAATPYLQAAQLPYVYLEINAPSGVNLFTGSLTPYYGLKFNACAGLGFVLSNEPLLVPLDYQYSKKRSGPWKTLGVSTEAPYPNTECTDLIDYPGDGEYPGHFTAPLANGYYRAYVPAGPGQMSSVSKVIHLWGYPTKITGFAISPRRVNRDGKVTVSGRLLELKSKWLPDKGATITIEYRYKTKTYKLRRQLTTNSAGRFKGTFRVPRSAAWLAVYSGAYNVGYEDFATASTSIRITVR